MDPDAVMKQKAKEASKVAMKKLKLKVELNEYEERLAREIIFPEEIQSSFKDIGGLDKIIESLKESVIYPLVYPQLFASVSNLLSPPRGVLLYGPPGCGKTLLAKSIAKQSGANFINLHPSSITDKYFGESQRLVMALFSLARKLEPCIIFIDEIDAFLRTRKSSDHEASALIKSEFMVHWDGLEALGRVMVLGATNRVSDIDPAILRRMPKRVGISLPNQHQRLDVLKLILGRIFLDQNVDLELLASMTEGFSNSDLKELCRNAVMIPVREAMRRAGPLDSDVKPDLGLMRRVNMEDFFGGMDSMAVGLADISGITLEPVD